MKNLIEYFSESEKIVSLETYINESAAGSKCFVLYAATKSGEEKLDERLHIGVYSSMKAMKEDMPKAEQYLKEHSKFADYEVLYYESNLNIPFIDL